MVVAFRVIIISITLSALWATSAPVRPERQPRVFAAEQAKRVYSTDLFEKLNVGRQDEEQAKEVKDQV